jgi:hypothetical protein
VLRLTIACIYPVLTYLGDFTMLFPSTLVLSGLLTFALAIPAPHRKQPANSHSQNVRPRAIFMMTNDAANAIAALPIGRNGLLSGGSVTSTGGAGSNTIDGTTNAAAAPDALVAQSSLTIAGNVRHHLE